MSCIVCCFEFAVQAKTGPDMVNITDILSREVQKSKVTGGVAHVTAIGSTASITTIEYEQGVINDLKLAISRLAPPAGDYEHDRAWNDGNGHSHVQAAIIGPSITVPVRHGKLLLGTWQQVIVINHDNKPRQRTVVVTVVGHERADNS